MTRDPDALDVVYSDPGEVGYHPVLYMVRLAADLLSGRLVLLYKPHQRIQDKVAGLALDRRRAGDKSCLLICAQPPDLSVLLSVSQWRTAYRKVVAWVFDSFWTDYIPRIVRIRNHFDALFVTEPDDLDTWTAISRTEVSCLPWGSDVLRFGSMNPNRSIDVLRVGRQPPEWDDDSGTRAAFARRGVAFGGRPPCASDADENQLALTHAFADSKFTLSFSNRVSPAIQTHPRREYITGRWTDALGCGATVAGVPPNSPLLDTLLWPGALLPLTSTELEAGVDTLSQAVRQWTPDRASDNYRHALRRLDWRWRFKTIADTLGVRSERLDSELAELESRARA